MIDVKLHPDTGDLMIPSKVITGSELVVSRAQARTETWRGEWILDIREGVPYLQWLDEVPVPVAQISDVLRREYEGIPGVARATVDVELNTETFEIEVGATIYLNVDVVERNTATTVAPATEDVPAVIKATFSPAILA